MGSALIHHVLIWELLAGLGLFLIGIYSTEEALKFLAGKRFKKIIQKHTNHPLKAIVLGTLSTAILQSSSAVTLMLLAFVGSGVLSLSNAIGVILGANLGTTITGWIVSTFGFELNINSFLYPLIAIGALTQFFLKRKIFLAQFGSLLLGIGLLFFGLSMMKSSVESLEGVFDPASIASYGRFLIFVVGAIFTCLIQSSSAAMAISLTAVHSGIVSLPTAAAFVVGADLGTTFTAVLGSLGGTPEKKRVAAAHVIFNLVSCGIALIILPQLLSLSQHIVGMAKPLYALVMFQSSFNFVGILLFFPFLKSFGAYLESKFKLQPSDFRIQEIDPLHPEASLESLKYSASTFYKASIDWCRHGIESTQKSPSLRQFLTESDDSDLRYQELKSFASEILYQGNRLFMGTLNLTQSQTNSNILIGVRDSLNAVKAVKDVRHDLLSFFQSSHELVGTIGRGLAEFQIQYYYRLQKLSESTNVEALTDIKQQLRNEASQFYESIIKKINEGLQQQKIPLKYPSSLINANRELYQSNQYWLTSF